MQESVIEAHPAADLSITVVWSDWWPADAEGTSRRSSALIDPQDDRVAHFYDPKREIGKAVARSLGWDDPEEDANAAWDIYLFYPAGVRWDAELPRPARVIHQLSRRKNDNDFRTGEALVASLREATTTTVATGGR